MEAKLEEETQEQGSVTPGDVGGQRLMAVRARRRVIAYILDFMIVFFVVTILSRVPGLSKVPPIVYTSLYFVLFWAWRGQTPGKIILGIRIVRLVRQDVRPPGFIRALVRYIVGLCGLIAFSVLYMLGVGRTPCVIVAVVAFVIIVLSVSFDRPKRGIHDKLAGTYVIDVPRQAPQEIEEEVEEEAGEESPPPAEEKAEEKSPSP